MSLRLRKTNYTHPTTRIARAALVVVLAATLSMPYIPQAVAATDRDSSVSPVAQTVLDVPLDTPSSEPPAESDAPDDGQLNETLPVDPAPDVGTPDNGQVDETVPLNPDTETEEPGEQPVEDLTGQQHDETDAADDAELEPAENAIAPLSLDADVTPAAEIVPDAANLINSGTSNTVSWYLTKADYATEPSTLVLYPTNGSEGTLASSTLGNGTSYDWNANKADVLHIRVAATVKLGAKAQGLFYFMTNLVDIAGLENLQCTSATTDISSLFQGCSSLETLDLSSWDVSSVTSLTSLFSGCGNLTLTGDLSEWHTGRLTSLSWVFASCAKLTTLNLSGWNVSGSASFSNMFGSCTNLEQLNLASWDTSNMTDASNMFYQCTSLERVDGLAEFDVSHVTNMSNMFVGCMLKSGGLGDCVFWDDLSALQYMTSMFKSTTSDEELDLSAWSATLGSAAGTLLSASYLFESASLPAVILPNVDFSGKTSVNISRSFTKSSIRRIDMSGWRLPDEAGVLSLDITGLFYYTYGNTVVSAVDMSNWSGQADVGRAAELGTFAIFSSFVMSGANLKFSGNMLSAMVNWSKDSLVTFDISSWDTRAVTGMDSLPVGPATRTVIVGPNWKPVGSKPKFSAPVGDLPDIPGAVCSGYFVNADGTRMGKQAVVPAGAGTYTAEISYEPVTGWPSGTFCNERVGWYVTPDDGSAAANTLVVYPINVAQNAFHTTWAEGGAPWASESARIAKVVVGDALRPDTNTAGFAWLFEGLSNVTAIEGLAKLDCGNVLSCEGMFKGCASLVSGDFGRMRAGLPQGASQYVSMNLMSMFEGCSSLQALDLTAWRVIVAQYWYNLDMTRMFYGCTSLASIDLSTWGPGNSPTLAQTNMLFGCTSLQTFSKGKHLNVKADCAFPAPSGAGLGKGSVYTGNWVDLSTNSVYTPDSIPVSTTGDAYPSVITYQAQEGYVPGSDSWPQGTSGGVSWYLVPADAPADTPQGTPGSLVVYPTNFISGTMNSMTSSNDVPWYPVRNSVKSVFFARGVATGVGTYAMFSGCKNMTSIEGLENLDTSGTSNMSMMFDGCGALTSLDLSMLDTSSASDLSYMLRNCTSLTSVNLAGLDFSHVTTLKSLFSACTQLTSVNLAGTSPYRATSFENMFINCSSLTTLDLSGFDTRSGTTFLSMFSGCSSLTTLDASGFDTRSATTLQSMFYQCSQLTALNVSGWDVSNVTTLNSMFAGCSALQGIDPSAWRPSALTNMALMFNECRQLTTLDLSGWNVSKVSNASSAFRACSNLTVFKAPSADNTLPDTLDLSYLFSGCSSLVNLDLSMWQASDSTTMGAFVDCSALETLDISTIGNEFGDLSGQFNRCSSLREVNLGPWFRFENTSDGSTGYLPTPPTGVAGDEPGSTTNGKWTCSRWGKFAPEDMNGWQDGVWTWAYDYAVPDNAVTSGTSGGVTWYLAPDPDAPVDYAGTGDALLLVAFPATGDTGRFSNLDDVAPWNEHMSRITHVKFALGLQGDTTSNYGFRKMFLNASELRGGDFGDLDLTGVASLYALFTNCSKLTELDLSAWKTTGVYDAGMLFTGCSNLKTLNLFAYDHSSVAGSSSDRIARAFENCSSLKELDLSSWNTASATTENGTSMTDAFTGMTSLERLVLGAGWRFKSTSAEAGVPAPSGAGITPGTSRTGSWVNVDTGQVYTANALPNGEGTYVAQESYGSAGATLAEGTSGAEGNRVKWYITAASEPDPYRLVMYPDPSNNDPTTGMLDSFEVATDVPWNEYTGQVMSVSIAPGVKTNEMASCMFQTARITSVDLSNLDMSATNKMTSMFERCKSLTTAPDLSGVGASSSVTEVYAARVFYGCNKLVATPVMPSKTTSLYAAFAWCPLLSSMDTITSPTGDFQAAFSNCPSLVEIPANFSLAGVSEAKREGCFLLESPYNADNRLETVYLGDDNAVKSYDWKGSNRVVHLGKLTGSVAVAPVAVGSAVVVGSQVQATASGMSTGASAEYAFYRTVGGVLDSAAVEVQAFSGTDTYTCVNADWNKVIVGVARDGNGSYSGTLSAAADRVGSPQVSATVPTGVSGLVAGDGTVRVVDGGSFANTGGYPAAVGSVKLTLADDTFAGGTWALSTSDGGEALLSGPFGKSTDAGGGMTYSVNPGLKLPSSGVDVPLYWMASFAADESSALMDALVAALADGSNTVRYGDAEFTVAYDPEGV